MNILTATTLAMLSTTPTPTPAQQSTALPVVVAMHAAYVACDGLKAPEKDAKRIIGKALNESGLGSVEFSMRVRDAATIMVRDLALSGRLPEFCRSMRSTYLTIGG